jgi:hypothetical protein|tara:strand:- start:1073 stop:1597 length:525 start_codon:yes stop_codon:yes gene_type:complete
MFDYIKKYKIKDFDRLQNEVLMAIEMIKASNETKYAKMSASDYKVDLNGGEELYRKQVHEMVDECVEDYMSGWRCSDWEMQNCWFAEYRNGADFDYHTHEGCNMSGVISLVLDEPRNGTKLMGSDIQPSEGEVVLFPGMLPHKSPYVYEGEKIVIGFNWNMMGSDVHSTGIREE